MKRKRSIIAAALTGLAFLGFLFFLYRTAVQPVAAQNLVVLERELAEGESWPLTDQKNLVQEFRIQEAYFEQIGILFDVKKQKNPYTVSVRLEEKGGSLVQEWLVEDSLLSCETYTPLGLDNPVEDGEGKTYQIKVAARGITEKGVLGVKRAKGSKETTLLADGTQKKNDMAFVVKGSTAYAVKELFFWLAAGLGILLGVIFLGIFKNWSLQRMFLPVGLALGMLYLAGVPLMAGPDETRHGATAYSFSNELLGWPAVNEEGLVPSRAEDEVSRYRLDRIPGRDSFVRIYQNLGSRGIREGRGTLRAPLHINKLLYLPQTLGITAARLLGVNGLWLYYIGRICGLLFYLGVVYLAIRIMPFGKGILFFTACLPTCMQQAAIITYDTMVMAFSFLMTAHILYLAYEKGRVSVLDWIPSMLSMAVILPAKIVYVFLAFLLILVPAKKYKRPVLKWLGILAAMAAGFAASAAVSATGAVDILSRKANTVPWGDEPSYTLAYILAEPLKTIGVFCNSFLELGKDYLGTMAGRYLCTYFDVRVSYWILAAFWGIVILAALRVGGEKVYYRIREKWLFAFVFLGSAMAACFSMLMAYTSIYSPVLQGVQGRYFLPVLPVLLLMFRSGRPALKRSIDGELVWAMGILHVLTLSTLFVTIISR